MLLEGGPASLLAVQAIVLLAHGGNLFWSFMYTAGTESKYIHPIAFQTSWV